LTPVFLEDVLEEHFLSPPTKLYRHTPVFSQAEKALGLVDVESLEDDLMLYEALQNKALFCNAEYLLSFKGVPAAQGAAAEFIGLRKILAVHRKVPSDLYKTARQQAILKTFIERVPAERVTFTVLQEQPQLSHLAGRLVVRWSTRNAMRCFKRQKFEVLQH
jgi:hypothetical protein